MVRTRLAIGGLFCALLFAAGCLPFGLGNEGPDSEYGPPNEWDVEPPEGLMLAGSKLMITMTGPMSCSGGTFGIGGTCELSTIDSVHSSVPSVATVEGFSASHLELRAGLPGLAKISFQGATPGGDDTSGGIFIGVAEAEDAEVEFFTECGKDTALEDVTFPRGAKLSLSAVFTLDDGTPLVGGEVEAPVALDPPSAGGLSGTVNDGGLTSISLDVAADAAVSEVALKLTSGKELARVSLATPSTIDGWRVEPALFNPNLVEYGVVAELTVGSKRICFDPYAAPSELQYTVTYETPEICDAGFGSTSVMATTSFTIKPNAAGECVVRLSYGSLEEVLTYAVSP